LNSRSLGSSRHPLLRDRDRVSHSLGYTLLTNEIASLVEATGFDPFIGFLHGLRYGRQSLSLDLVEEFRHPVIDGLVLTLTNKGSVRETDFNQQDSGAFMLSKPAFGHFVELYENRMEREFEEKEAGSQTSYRKLIRRHVEMMQNVVLNKGEYQPFLVQ